MRNIYEVMRQKEQEIERLRKEMQALHIVAPLLGEELTEGEAPVAAAAVPPYLAMPQKSAPVAGAHDSRSLWP
jgi:hypothetical protein